MQIAPTLVEVAWQLLGARRFEESARQARRALASNPDNASALACAGMAEWELGHSVAHCIALLQRAVDLAPEVGPHRHNLGTLQASMGDMAGAYASFAAALRIRGDDTLAFYAMAQNHRFTEPEPVIDDMLALYGSGMLSRTALEFLCFGLAKVYADMGNRARAMHFCIEANWLADRPYDRMRERRRVQALLDIARAHRLPLTTQPVDGPAPVFIVGMPRSGTTLAEAILARHPAVLALGESPLMGQVEHELTGGDSSRLTSLDAGQLSARAQQAMRTMASGATGATRVVVDKTPDNAFRIGLIAALFPNARIIHMRRHPLDCGLSNLFTRFTAGQGFAFRQVDLGERIRQTADVMAAWKASVPLPMLDLSYESLVADPEAQSRRLIDFVGLDWNDACLTPELDQRQIHTASQWQVRQKINTASVGRFVGYREWLSAMIEAMGGEAWVESETQDQLRAG
ncbi:sulfotransferase [Devosia sp. FKR38]|uniref:tetratricopeptide repeat-containing sulfotransferase family protein n=1 Tax=Devosia sp. FKR38 TaxID=2562312 RepID=UPI0010C1420E|nr:sulfotransferase [Devosia sp. FKR38]